MIVPQCVLPRRVTIWYAKSLEMIIAIAALDTICRPLIVLAREA